MSLLFLWLKDRALQLTTHRLTIKPVQDRDHYLSLMAQSHKRLLPEVFGEDAQFPIASDQELLELLLTASKTLVGGLSVTRRGDRLDRREIGFWIRPEYARQGFIIEAVEALMLSLFRSDQVKKLEMRCDGRNIASQNLAKKLGFHPEAIWSGTEADRGGPKRILAFARYNTDKQRDE